MHTQPKADLFLIKRIRKGIQHQSHPIRQLIVLPSLGDCKLHLVDVPNILQINLLHLGRVGVLDRHRSRFTPRKIPLVPLHDNSAGNGGLLPVLLRPAARRVHALGVELELVIIAGHTAKRLPDLARARKENLRAASLDIRHLDTGPADGPLFAVVEAFEGVVVEGAEVEGIILASY